MNYRLNMQRNRQQNGTFVVLVIDTLGCGYTHARIPVHAHEAHPTPQTASCLPDLINRNTNRETAKRPTQLHAMYQDTEDTYRRSAGPLWSAAGKYQGRCILRSKRSDISYLKRSKTVSLRVIQENVDQEVDKW